MDPSLTGKLWVAQVCRKSFALLNRFYRCGGIRLPLRARRALVNALVTPSCDYGGIPFSGLKAVNINKLQRIQNCCMRFIYAIARKDSVSHMYVEANILRIQLRRNWLRMILFLETVIKNEGPSYLRHKFIHQNHNYNTKNQEHSFSQSAGHGLFSRFFFQASLIF